MSRLMSLFASRTGLREQDIAAIVRNAPIRYKTYLIPKRNGGARVISQPARELKALQRVIVSEILYFLPIHDAATAYRAGASIKRNAEIHSKNGPILKFDFQDFFPSIVGRDWESYCRRFGVFDNEDDIVISTRVLFHRPKGSSILRLAIGAPSSPCLSNVLMNAFDTRISQAVAEDYVTYTRYADDLTFSAGRTGYLTGVNKALRQAIWETGSPSLHLNEKKTVLATKKYKRAITGLIITNDGKVSLGHERKKIIRATLHHAKRGLLNTEELNKLSGLLAFARDIEPDFYRRVQEKYGSDFISLIRASLHKND